ncbi:hypothetical protein CYMTET_48656 [Cymbomonas tetramitiformis]|uniref:Uncharacterized protein n=1 Tax=Cymbomonas tetramitiformis TaxID=36881 RepID=A0AAE0BTI6_9CHLO|nr:hypothetical protein CYMTET_48656 [Cymbomonas tetramitiformis]
MVEDPQTMPDVPSAPQDHMESEWIEYQDTRNATAETTNVVQPTEDKPLKNEKASDSSLVENQKNEAALQIQRVQRGRAARERVAELKQGQSAAVSAEEGEEVQAAGADEEGRAQAQRQDEAALQIQRVQRGRAARERVAELKQGQSAAVSAEEGEEVQAADADEEGRAQAQRQDEAALQIQRAQRQDEAALQIQRVQRGRAARERVAELKQGQSAAVSAEEGEEVQAADADEEGRAQAQRQDEAALQIQRVQRGRAARERVAELKQGQSAAVSAEEGEEVQAADADEEGRAQAQRQDEAALQIQRVQRGRAAREHVKHKLVSNDEDMIDSVLLATVLYVVDLEENDETAIDDCLNQSLKVVEDDIRIELEELLERTEEADNLLVVGVQIEGTATCLEPGKQWTVDMDPVTIKGFAGKKPLQERQTMKKQHQSQESGVLNLGPQATIIQRHYRGFQGRQQYAKKSVLEHSCATSIQRVYRGHSSRKDVFIIRDTKQKEDSAICIQRYQRGKAARKEVAEIRSRQQYDRDLAIAKELQHKNEAAIEVQRFQRGRASRARVAQIRAEKYSKVSVQQQVTFTDDPVREDPEPFIEANKLKPAAEVQTAQQDELDDEGTKKNTAEDEKPPEKRNNDELYAKADHILEESSELRHNIQRAKDMNVMHLRRLEELGQASQQQPSEAKTKPPSLDLAPVRKKLKPLKVPKISRSHPDPLDINRRELTAARSAPSILGLDSRALPPAPLEKFAANLLAKMNREPSRDVTVKSDRHVARIRGARDAPSDNGELIARKIGKRASKIDLEQQRRLQERILQTEQQFIERKKQVDNVLNRNRAAYDKLIFR